MSDHALFAVAPFIALVVLVVATALRPPHDSSLNMRPPSSSAAVVREARMHPLIALGLLGVLAGHIVMLAWPDQLLRWSRDVSRLMALELAFLALGVSALFGIGAAVWRRVLRSTASGASLADAMFSGVLLLALASGVAVAVLYRWAAAWSAVTSTRYARSLFLLQPNVEPLDALPYLAKVHIFSTFIIIGLLPFTRLIGVVQDTLHRATTLVIGPFATAFDRQRSLIQGWALRSSRRLMWPEEED
jgi:nitrate reductase gamma subunit